MDYTDLKTYILEPLLRELITYGAPLAAAAILTQFYRLLAWFTSNIKNKQVREFVEARVLEVEQSVGTSMSNELKRQQVIEWAKKRFPRVPEPLIRTFLEAAVKAMNERRAAIEGGGFVTALPLETGKEC